jgi:hypothetical protein
VEFCIKCGNDVEELNPLSGWCIACSTDYCPKCGKLKKNNRELCNSCIRIKWLEDHADEIEEEQSKGLSLSKAREAIYDKNRPTCLVCNNKISGANGSALFCNKTTKCKQAKRRYRTLRTGAHNLPPQVAVEQVLRELGKLSE